MYKELAKYYDKIYYWKDYKDESERLHRLIQKNKKSAGNEMLDVGCGTGNHIQYLQKYYNITGVDLNPEMLKVARQKLPGTKFIRGDMRSFRLNKQFDVIVSLFGAISHLKTIRDLEKVFRNFYVHLKKGGLIVVETFISPDKFKKDFLHAVFVDEPELKMTRMSKAKRKGNIFIFDFHFLILKKSGIKYVNNIHSARMYTVREFLAPMRRAGLKAKFLKNSLMQGRGLYIGV